MKIKPKISVIMPVYNGERYISKSIESILNQTFTDFEFIIIDDGSKDKTAEIIKHYSKIDKRILPIYRKKNIGLTKNLNFGIEISNGKFIARQDADDISHIERFKIQYNLLKNKKNVVVCGTWSYKIDIYGNIFGYLKCYNKTKDIKDKLLKFGTPFPHGSAMFNKNNFLKYKGYNTNYFYSQDKELWVRLFLDNPQNIFIIEEYLYYFRISENKNIYKEKMQFIYNILLNKKMYNYNFNESKIILYYSKKYNYLKNKNVINTDNYFVKIIFDSFIDGYNNKNIYKININNIKLFKYLILKIIIKSPKLLKKIYRYIYINLYINYKNKLLIKKYFHLINLNK